MFTQPLTFIEGKQRYISHGAVKHPLAYNSIGGIIHAFIEPEFIAGFENTFFHFFSY
jgi:hypothetical protein